MCKRIARRLRALELPNPAAYRRYLESTPAEWAVLDACCWISISRFYRDRGVFDTVRSSVLPALARQAREARRERLRAWCAGCAAGEEVYTLALIWEFSPRCEWPELHLETLGTDTDEHQLERARRATYPASSLRDLPASWRLRAFDATPAGYRLRQSLRSGVSFERQDLRCEMPDGAFDLVLCRNVAFTYFEARLQARVAREIAARLAPGGALVLGTHEELPDGLRLTPWPAASCIYRSAGPDRVDI